MIIIIRFLNYWAHSSLCSLIICLIFLKKESIFKQEKKKINEDYLKISCSGFIIGTFFIYYFYSVKIIEFI